MMRRWMVAAFGAALVIAIGWVVAQDGKPGRSVTPEEALALVRSDSSVVLLDVRTPAEYHGPTGHLAGSTLIPVQELERRMSELGPYKDRKFLVYCRTDNRSRRAVEMLRSAGYHATYIVGGIVEWNAKGLPLAKEDAR